MLTLTYFTKKWSSLVPFFTVIGNWWNKLPIALITIPHNHAWSDLINGQCRCQFNSQCEPNCQSMWTELTKMSMSIKKSVTLQLAVAVGGGKKISNGWKNGWQAVSSMCVNKVMLFATDKWLEGQWPWSSRSWISTFSSVSWALVFRPPGEQALLYEPDFVASHNTVKKTNVLKTMTRKSSDLEKATRKC